MARMTDEQWELLEADYHTGQYSKNQLAEKYELSHTAVNKRLKDIKPKFQHLVSTQIAIKTQLSEQSCKQVSAIETAVAEAIRHLEFFTKSALKNQKLANDKLSQETSLQDLESHSRITQRNKDTVLGKQPENVINNQQNNTIQSLKVEFV